MYTDVGLWGLPFDSDSSSEVNTGPESTRARAAMQYVGLIDTYVQYAVSLLRDAAICL